MDRETFLQALESRRREIVRVEVPSLGGAVHVRRLRVSDLEELGLLRGEQPSLEQLVGLVARSLVSPDGSPLLEAEEASRLAEADLETFMRLFGTAAQVNGLAGSEELVAGFGAAQREGSSNA